VIRQLPAGLRLTGPAEPLEDDAPPARWDGGHVGLRLCEAFRTLRQLPMSTGARGFQQNWPAYRYEFQDLLAQQEQGELERTMALRNVARITPSWREVTRMEIAIAWPSQFLREKPEIAIATNAVALAHATDRDCGWVATKYGGYADTWRDRHTQGCEIIARALRANRVTVS
jgi:hypothetical protein